MKLGWIVIVLFSMSPTTFAADVPPPDASEAAPAKAPPSPSKKKVVYENQTINFEGLSLEGELNAPGEFYFQNRSQEQFDSLTKRRTNFRREMLRDAVQSN